MMIFDIVKVYRKREMLINYLDCAKGENENAIVSMSVEGVVSRRMPET